MSSNSTSTADAKSHGNATTSNTALPSGGSGSKAWIAGPIIGALVVLALIVGLEMYFLLRRQRSGPSVDVRREQSQPLDPDSNWSGKAELHAEFVVSPAFAMKSVDVSRAAELPSDAITQVGAKGAGGKGFRVKKKQISVEIGEASAPVEMGVNPRVQGVPPELP